MPDRGETHRAILRARDARRELVRRAVLEGPPDAGLQVLIRHVLGFQLRSFHVEQIIHQESAKETLSLAPRGYGKSTILTVARSVFEILRNPNIRILIASKTALQAEVFLREIKAHLQNNHELVMTFGPQVGSEKWDNREITVAGRTEKLRESTVTTLGVGGPVASRHYDLIIGDDLVDDRNSRTEVGRDHVKTWYYKSLLPTVVDATSRVHLVGTLYHPLDLWNKIIAEDRDVRVLRIQALPPDGTTPWPEKFSVEQLKALRRKMGTAIFNSQYQNDTELMRGTIFRPEWFRYWDSPPVESWARTDTWVGCDPAATKSTVILSGRKADSDWWSLCAVSREIQDDGTYSDRFYVRRLWRERCTKARYIDEVGRWQGELGPVVFAVESTGAQEHLCQDLQAIVPVRRVERTTDKVSRAYRMQPFFENGQILFPSRAVRRTLGDEDTWQALEDELALFPDTDHDDLFDALETAVMASLNVVDVFLA
jgi:predicted phage terminase large subunit-like protein